MKSIITKDFGITNAKNFEQMVTLPLANVYVSIGRTIAWPNTANSSVLDDITVTTPYDTTDYKNKLRADSILLKKITNSDIQAVAPRVDWTTDAVYVPYDQTLNVFTKIEETEIAGGTVNVNVSSQRVDSNTINLAASVPVLSVGSIIRVEDDVREVCSINAVGDYLTVNTPFWNAHTGNLIYKVVTSETNYANDFYVRNTRDQVFKCLENNNGANSTAMPEISLGGQLPEDPFIETADGYKWKYLYTISTGVKNKFFTDQYMPVLKDQTVYDSAVDGRIDIVKIVSGGDGYFQGSSVNNYPIATVTGDGSEANVTVDITSGVVTKINFLDRGMNYTNATLSLNDPLQLRGANAASFRVVIGPQNGHGYDPIRELGASDQMISVDFVGDVDGYMPTENDGTDTIRQICLIKDPRFQANNVPVTGSIYAMYTKVYTSKPAINFSHNQIVYVGSSLDRATFTARVVHFDETEDVLYINQIVGNVLATVGETMYQSGTATSARVYSVQPPDINIFSGELMYIENRSKITRSLEQTDTLKLVVEF